MSEQNSTPANEGELEDLRRQSKRLAEDKASLQLVIQLIEQVHLVQGFDTQVTEILNSVITTIGGTNMQLWYWVENELCYADFSGNRLVLDEISDPLALQALHERRFIESSTSAENSLLQGNIVPDTVTWTFPLLAGEELVGITKLENIAISVASLGKYLSIFFNHIALIISNEVRRHLGQEAEVRYHELLEGIHVAIVVHAADTSILDLNRCALDLLGLTEDQMRGHTAFHPEWCFLDEHEELLPPESYPVNHVISTGQAVRNMVYGIVRPMQKDVVWVLVNADPVKDPSGHITQIRVSFADITDKKLAEAKLRISEEHFRAYFECSMVGMATTSLDKDWINVNDALCETLGYSREELKQMTWEELACPEDLHADASQFKRMLKGEINSYAMDKRFFHRDGHIVHTRLVVSCVHRKDGSPDYVVVLVEDITERKKAEEEVQKINNELEQRIQERTADLESFAYSVSHDLRVPLRAIDGFSYMLLDEYGNRLDNEGKRKLQVVRNNSQRMGQLIDDILAFSRASRLGMRPGRVDMEDLVREAWQDFASQLGERKVEINIYTLPSVQCDTTMLRQVWANLLGNAVKFTIRKEKAKIEVGGMTQGNECIYYVKDNGAGFDMQYAGKLFGVFQRLHGVCEFEGTGIGLAIVKRIIARHGGRVWAEGKVEEGATIYFALPNKT